MGIISGAIDYSDTFIRTPSLKHFMILQPISFINMPSWTFLFCSLHNDRSVGTSLTSSGRIFRKIVATTKNTQLWAVMLFSG